MTIKTDNIVYWSSFVSKAADILKNITYNTVSWIKSVSSMQEVTTAFPALRYVFLPAAATFAVFSFGFNLIAKLNSKNKQSLKSWWQLTLHGILSLGLVAATVSFYLLTSFVASLIFTITLGIAAISEFSNSMIALYNAFKCKGEVRRAYLTLALNHFLNSLGALAISSGMIIAETLGATRIVNIIIVAVNLPLILRDIFKLIKDNFYPKVVKEETLRLVEKTNKTESANSASLAKQKALIDKATPSNSFFAQDQREDLELRELNYQRSVK
ncbi:MAG: hypothetical protein A3F18_00450 [Legionellales bacterium RIFCSPHIGHO2_12_FULL_37_14]|nr:MAG: hypothetical protein A3F18_00450 [Legionellales bacterium RIFCSPHIGHO2_12_FULL_37_14]